jgi:hypothetical protein
LAIVGLAAIFFGSDSWAVCYVNQNATGKNNGTTWTDAYVHPQLALLNGCTEIWVAKGVYTPVLAGSDPTVSFDIPAGTKMYGGFAGGESSVDQRLPTVNLTVLSGDVEHNDDSSGEAKDLEFWANVNPYFIRGKNSFHVVTMFGPTASPITGDTILDGFLITAGAAMSDTEASGGAVYCRSDSDVSGECSPTLRNLILVGNTAKQNGGALAFASGKARPSIVNSLFLTNGWSPDAGGAIYVAATDAASELAISGCMFFNNYAGLNGGAVETQIKTTLVNTTFLENTAFNGIGGAIHITSNGPLSVVNATFSQNFSRHGGNAIANELDGPPAGSGTISLFNSIVWGNSGIGTSSDILNGPSLSAYAGSDILEQGCPDFRSVCIDVSDENPKLALPAFDEQGLGNVLPGAGGSAIDRGDDAVCPSADERGVLRPQGAHCDIGAFEWKVSDDVIFRNGFQ